MQVMNDSGGFSRCWKFIWILITVHRNANELRQGRAARRVQGSHAATTRNHPQPPRNNKSNNQTAINTRNRNTDRNRLGICEQTRTITPDFIHIHSRVSIDRALNIWLYQDGLRYYVEIIIVMRVKRLAPFWVFFFDFTVLRAEDV